MFTLKNQSGEIRVIASRLADAEVFVNPVDSRDEQLYLEEIKCTPSQLTLENTPKTTKNAQER